MHYVLLALLFALLIGIVGGLRAMTPLAWGPAWGAMLGWINLADAPHGAMVGLAGQHHRRGHPEHPRGR